jgi:hypothetical protein
MATRAALVQNLTSNSRNALNQSTNERPRDIFNFGESTNKRIREVCKFGESTNKHTQHVHEFSKCCEYITGQSTHEHA